MAAKSTQKKLASIFLVAATALSLFSVFYFTIVLSKDSLNSDVFDTIMWAKATYESGSLFAHDFNYAAFLPFGGSLLMLPFIYIFGVSFTTHTIGMILFEIIFFGSLVLFAKKINFNANQIMFFIISMCSLWLCGTKFREMFCQHIIYYSLSVLFIFIGYTLLVSLTESFRNGNKKKLIILSFLTFIFFFLVATDGFQLIFISTVPLVGGFLLERFFCLKTKLLSNKNIPEIFSVLLALIATGIGFIVTYVVTKGNAAGYASAYSVYDSETALEWVEKLRIFFVDYYQLFGVSFPSGTSFTDFAQFSPLIRFAFSTLVFLSLPVTAVLFKKINNKDLKRIFFITVTMFSATVFLWFFGVIGGASWRLIPMISCLLILFVCDLVYFCKKTYYLRFNAPIIAVAVMFFFVSIIGVLSIKPSGKKYGEHQNIIEKIENSGIYNGYSDFWVSSVINVMSGEELNSYNIRYDNDKLCLYEYQQFKYDETRAPYNSSFMVLSANDAVRFEKSESYNELLPYLTEKYDEKKENRFVVYFYSKDIGYIFKE